jgi:uncharacterized protein YjbI with pentapeptide repeats
MKLQLRPRRQANPHDFVRQNLQGRSFRGRDLTGADFTGANLQGADFRQANLTDSNFHQAKIQGANFTQAQLARANLTGAVAGIRPIQKRILWAASSLLAGIAGLGFGLAASWIMNLIVVDNKLLKFGATDTGVYSMTAGIASAEILIVILVVLLRSGLGEALRIGGINAMVVGLGSSLGVGVLTGTKFIVSNAGVGEAGAGVGGSIAMALVITMTAILLLALMVTIQESWVGAGMMASVGLLFVVYANFQPPPPPPIMAIGMIIWNVIFLVSGLWIGRRSTLNHFGYQQIRHFAIVITTLWGTKFYRSSLIEADLSHAHLKYSDFRKINSTHTLWYQSRHLDWARVGNTILINPAIRDLLVSGDGQQQSYIGMDLRGANLAHANLKEANFSQADLSAAILKNACLEWAILTQTQAIGANFQDAQMTGACGLGTWNIDGTTQLDDVQCRWIYLLEQAKPNTDDRERRPSSGEFAPEEFTSLFREVVDTIDLIFRNGIDQRAFSQSLQQVKAENNAAQLELQSLENKGNGIVIAKLKTTPTVNKGNIHHQFTQFYQDAVLQLNQQQGVLDQHDQQIQTLYEKLDQLTKRTLIDQFVLIQIHPGDFEIGFPVTLQIFRYEEGVAPLSAQTQGSLPPNNQLVQSYQYWQSAYRRSLKATRLDVPSQVTHVSSDDFFSDCLQAKRSLIQQINTWLSSDSFRPIERAMQINLDRDQPVRIILQTEHPQLRLLPWQTWRFFQDYTQAELALSKPDYHSPPVIAKTHHPIVKNSVKILAILGDSRGIDLQHDRAALEAIDADITFLVEPKRQELSETLWQQDWDILFFAGHSRSQPDGASGQLWLNSTEPLSIADLQYALTQSINHGLKLTIFNSCDGLGLANELADLQIPQMIVMRQPVPDAVAQAFLSSFLQRFAQGQPFYQAVRTAREQLHDLEDQNPCASWLPVIIQNPATLPPTWQDFHRRE